MRNEISWNGSVEKWMISMTKMDDFHSKNGRFSPQKRTFLPKMQNKSEHAKNMNKNRTKLLTEKIMCSRPFNWSFKNDKGRNVFNSHYLYYQRTTQLTAVASKSKFISLTVKLTVNSRWRWTKVTLNEFMAISTKWRFYFLFTIATNTKLKKRYALKSIFDGIATALHCR